MANLRGSNHQKQIKSALMKMERFGKSRHNTESKNIHSEAVFKKREQILNEFNRYTQEQNIQGKLNTLMTNENISNFLNHKLENLQANTAENYCRSFSAMVDSLRDNNISVSVDKTVFNEKVLEAKNNDNTVVRMNRSVSNPNSVINNLYDRHYHSGIMSELSLETGFRLAETYELTTNLDKYLDRNTNTITGIVGKGGQIYLPKENIPQALIARIDAINKYISKSTYMSDLKAEGITSHDFRYSFCKNSYENKLDAIKMGNSELSHNDILKAVSVEMNHHRADITNYYLSKA